MAANLGTIRAAIKAAANGKTGGGYTLHANRVKLGYDPQTNDEDFFSSCAGTGSSTAGPFFNVKQGKITGRDDVSLQKKYQIQCYLWISPANRETDNDFTNEEALVEAIYDACTDIAGVTDLQVDEPEIDTKKNPILVHYVFTFTAESCS